MASQRTKESNFNFLACVNFLAYKEGVIIPDPGGKGPSGGYECKFYLLDGFCWHRCFSIL